MPVSLSVLSLITTTSDRKYDLVGRMADAILDVLGHKADCQPADLYSRGFAARDVAQHWHMARAMADVELHLSHPCRPSNRQVAHG